MARRAGERGGVVPAVLNAANEVCVDAFLRGACRFDQITTLVGEAVEAAPAVSDPSVEDVLDADRWARRRVAGALALPAGAAPVKAVDAQGVEAVLPIAMEDWWLARDAKGRAGWLLSHYVDVDAPDSVAKYSEGQRIVGAYELTIVHDDGAEQDNKDIPIYLTVLSPYTAGLPYDFDQVRVFTWNLKMHRYETAYREKNIEGYLPVTIKSSADPYGKSATAQTSLPTFTYKVLAADAGTVVPDAVTGMVTPGRTIEKTYRLEGNLVRRIQAAGSAPDDEAHPVAEVKKDKKGKKK